MNNRSKKDVYKVFEAATIGEIGFDVLSDHNDIGTFSTAEQAEKVCKFLNDNLPIDRP